MGETVAAFVRHLRMEGKSPNTIRLYGGTLRELQTYLDQPLLTATAHDLIDWRASLAVQPSSVATYVAAVRSFYRWCVRYGLRADDPSMLVPVPKLGRRMPRPVAEIDLEHAIDTACDRIRPWLILAAYSGFRCLEVAQLRREDIHDSAPEPFVIARGKGNKERSVPLSPYVWGELRHSIARKGWAFPRRDGRPGHTPASTVSQLGNDHLKACGLSDTMHGLRHRFGTQTYAVSRDLRVVQELMGHGSSKTTELYAAHSLERAVQAVAAVQPRRRGLRPVRDQ